MEVGKFIYKKLFKQGYQNVPSTSGWAPSTNLSKIKIEVGKTEMLSRYLLFPRSLL
jgi:hypothetical protein